MEKLPPEVLQIICQHLDFQDAANVRFLTRDLANIAAEFLVTRVCFHTSLSSLARLEKIANHPIFSKTVKALVYEAALLADIGCRHEYGKHFELPHHGIDKPIEPALTCSARERRLYIRNKRKWSRSIDAKYNSYRTLFDAQKLMMESDVVEKVLSRCIPRFLKLTSIDVDPVRRCSHILSERFVGEFGMDCASPLSANMGKISDQSLWMLLPKEYIIESLRKLHISSLSPSFFQVNRRSALQATFKSLIDIDITLTLADGDLRTGEHPRDAFQRHLSTGVLIDVLSAATQLEVMFIGVDDKHPLFVDLTALISKTTWTQLRSLGLNTISSTQIEFIDIIKRQPKLKTLHIAFMQLTHGNWPDTLTQMRNQLDLQNFMPVGYLEDPDETWPMDFLDVSAYIHCQEEVDLSSEIDLYVTHVDRVVDILDDLPLRNPLKEAFDRFEDPDMIRDMYGSLYGSSYDSDDMDLDDMTDEEMPTDDSGMPLSLLDWDDDML